MAQARLTFHIDADFKVKFIRLDFCSLLAAKFYPVFTLLFQNIFSMILGAQAAFRCPPDVMIDTMGVSFIYPIFRFLCRSKVVTYTHYPIISTDMLNMVENNVENFNNRRWIAKSRILTLGKIFYYKSFAWLYRLAGKCCHSIMVNSSWTLGHIRELWSKDAITVYPPCNTDNLKKISLTLKKPALIISMAQFRPEKNHRLQLESFKHFITLMDEHDANTDDLEFHIIGSCRNEEDYSRVRDLEAYSKELEIDRWVQFRVNLPYREMEELMGRASIALHTMTNEHFGISVVEFLAAGIVTISHRSGGPLMDIITQGETGFFATTKEEFGRLLYDLRHRKSLQQIRIAARDSVERFSERSFAQKFIETIEHLM